MADSDSELVALLREVVQWQRFRSRHTLKSALEEILQSDSDRKIYQLTDGKHSQPQIAKAALVSQPTISNKWKAWRKLGIVYESPEEPGRCCHLASLEDVGL